MKTLRASLMTALALGALLALSPASRAQDSKDAAKPESPATGQRPPRGGANAFDRMAERLKLSDDQKTKLKPIYQEEMTKMRELRADTSLAADEKRDKMRDLRQTYLGKMKPILTTEQYDDLKKMREQGPGRGPRGVRQGGDAKPPAAPPEK